MGLGSGIAAAVVQAAVAVLVQANPWSENVHMPQVQPKKKERERKEKSISDIGVIIQK